MMWGYGYGPHMAGFFGFGGILMGLVTFIILIFLIVFLVRIAGHRKEMITGPETALEILKKRYAKGEITKEEFDKIKQDL